MGAVGKVPSCSELRPRSRCWCCPWAEVSKPCGPRGELRFVERCACTGTEEEQENCGTPRFAALPCFFPGWCFLPPRRCSQAAVLCRSWSQT